MWALSATALLVPKKSVYTKWGSARRSDPLLDGTAVRETITSMRIAAHALILICNYGTVT